MLSSLNQTPGNQIQVIEASGHDNAPDVASPFDNIIIVNPNFKTKFLPLAKNDAEISTNAYAFKMLADFYLDENTDRYSKLYDFMAYFGISMSLESGVRKNI